MEPLQWAYPEDIPGSRCTPEDGPWPRAFYLLDEAEIWEEFQRLADPSSILFNAENGWRADGVNFQPSPMASTQDRYILRQLNIHGRLWALTGVFDGHLGEETVAHVAHHLPIIVEEFLQQYIPENPSEKITPGFISDLFSRSIVAFDDAIAGDILELFGGSDRLDRYSDQEIRDIINDQEKGGDNYQKARLCMYGTTALVALTDPEHENLWIANLGDCQAVLVSPRADTWDVEFLTTEHNTENDAEIERVFREHPGEPECVVNRRILGALAPTRGLGDVPFKQPPSFTRRILYNLAPGFSDTAPWEICLNRNLTPPYISAKADITHRPIAQLTGTPHRPYYLVLASDGFTELCRASGPERVLTAWAEREAKRPPHVAAEGNLASRLLRQAIGGEDRAGVSCMLTLDMDGPWVDDTAIVVQTL